MTFVSDSVVVSVDVLSWCLSWFSHGFLACFRIFYFDLTFLRALWKSFQVCFGGGFL